jgi:flagellar protein FlgJ
MNRQEFIDAIAPIAVQLRKEGSPLFPSVRIAQAILETGCVIHPWFNLCGIKAIGSPNAYWKGRTVNTKTWEVYDGKREDVGATWRAYDSIEDCYRDQDLIFDLDRYTVLRKAPTPEDQAVALYRCGYATDPEYFRKIIAIINAEGLKAYDCEPEPKAEEVEEVALDQGVALTILRTWLKPAWQQAHEAGNDDQASYIAWLGQELRKGANLPPDAE